MVDTCGSTLKYFRSYVVFSFENVCNLTFTHISYKLFQRFSMEIEVIFQLSRRTEASLCTVV